MQTVELDNGVEMPIRGVGTYQICAYREEEKRRIGARADRNRPFERDGRLLTHRRFPGCDGPDGGADLDGVSAGDEAMAEREAIKVMVTLDEQHAMSPLTHRLCTTGSQIAAPPSLQLGPNPRLLPSISKEYQQ